MPTCTDKPLKAGQTRDSAGRCFKKGLSVGFATGIEKGEKIGKKAGKKKGKKVTKRKLLLGHQMTALEVRATSKDMLRDILLRRNRRGLSAVGGISRMSKVALGTSLITELTNNGKLKA